MSGWGHLAVAALAIILVAGKPAKPPPPAPGPDAAAADAGADQATEPDALGKPGKAGKSGKAQTKSPAAPPDPCARLDAPNLPACADRLAHNRIDSGAAAKAPAVNGPATNAPANNGPANNAPITRPAPAAAGANTPKPAVSPPVVKPATKSVASKIRTPAPPAPGLVDQTRALIAAHPIVAGAGGGGAVLLVVGGLALALTRGRRGSVKPPTRMPATPPTRWRRDIVLTDGAGRDWRLDGARLTPGAIVGRDARCDLRRSETDIAEQHLELWVSEGRLMLRRLAEPVFLNDRLLRDAEPEIASTGDQVRLGSTTFTITID